MASFAPRARLLAWPLVAAMSMLGGSAFAQSAGGAQGAVSSDQRIQIAYAAWRKRTQSEVDCIDRTLKARGSSVRQLIQRGVWPSDEGLAGIRAACRTREKSNAVAAKDSGNALAAHEGVVVKTSETPLEKIPAPRPAPEKSAETAAAETAAVEVLAADRAAEKLAAEKSAIEKAAAEKAAAEKAAAEKAAADKAATAQAAADKVAADKAAKDAAAKAAAEKAAAERAAVEAAAAEKAAADKIASAQAAADRAATGKTAPARTEGVTPSEATQVRAERTREEAELAIAELTSTLSAAELKISFMYGLLTGVGSAALAVGAFLMLGFWRGSQGGLVASIPLPQTAGHSGQAAQSEVDRLVASVLADQKRRDRKKPLPGGVERKTLADITAPVV